MYKRIIAVAAALGMIYGSTLLPAADTGGEPVASVATNKQVVSKFKASSNTKYFSTKEKVYGPIRPVEVANDSRGYQNTLEQSEPGVEGSDNGDSAGGESEELQYGQLPDTDSDPGSEGGNDDGISGTDFDPGDYEPVSSGDNGEAGDYIEETGEDGGEDVEPEPEPYEPYEPDPEPYEPEEPQMEYLGDWTITAYCGCAECCGSWGNATASGAPAISGHTLACNILPFGTQVMIEGTIYMVEDTGYTIYGDAWADIYFDTHDEALAYGLHTASVYLVG